MQRRAVLGAVAGLASTAGCVWRATGDDYDIGMSAKRFLPTVYETTVGESVVWTNTSSRAHSVTAYEGRIPADAIFFASGGFATEQAARDAWLHRGGGTIDAGETYRHTVSIPGTYHYFCIPHEPQGMVGRLVVRE